MKKLALLLAAILSVSMLTTSCKPGDASSGSSSAASGAASSGEDTGSSDVLSGSEDNNSVVSDSTGSAGSTSTPGSNSTGGTTTSTGGTNQNWAGDKYVVQDLGTMQLEAYPDDTNYDWGQSVMKMGDTYKMWWCRQSPHDTIWYAESKDLKNWYNEQRVLEVTKDTTWIKMHVARPTVVFVNNKYYMYLEAPAVGGEGSDNNVFLATSTDGKKFTLYPSNDNPQPVIRQPESTMNKGLYGVGQPSAFYKDGKFYVYYTDAVGSDGIRVATSTDGINFGKYEDHKRVFDRAGCGVKYNSKTGKFMMLYVVDPSNWNSSLARNETVFLQESSDGINWPYKTVKDGAKNPCVISSDEKKVRGYADFVTNPQGVIDTETMYATFMQGTLAPKGSDWKTNYHTWDGHITMVNPKEYSKKPQVLPNGKTTSASALKAYADKNFKYSRQTANAKYASSAPKIDGEKDAIYKNSTEMKVNRQTPNWASVPTKTTASVWAAWDENYLYLYAEVKDSNISTKYPIAFPEEMWHRDSVDFYIDVPNNHTGKEIKWGMEQYLISACANGETVIKDKSDLSIDDSFSGLKKRIKKVSGGYNIELQIPWYSYVKSQIKANKTIGFDVQINDDPGTGDRASMVTWNDHTANSFRYTDVMGDLKLIK